MRYPVSGRSLSSLSLCSCSLKTLTFAGLPVCLQHEAHGAAAVDARRCIVALAVTAPVVDSTGLCLGGRWGMVTWLSACRSPRGEGREGEQRPKRRPQLPPCASEGASSGGSQPPSSHHSQPPAPHKCSQAVHFPPPYLIETRWTAVRQVQARAVRQECAEGVEEVERGGCREGKLSRGGSHCQGANKKGQQEFPPLSPDCLVGGWGHGGTVLRRVSLVIRKTAER